MNVLKILSSITESDIDDNDDLEITDIESELNDEYDDDDVEELDDDEDIEYTEEMVHVFGRKNGQYLVEADLLAKYMTSSHIKSVKEAIDNIARCNNIDASKVGLLIESSEYVSDLIAEAKSMKNDKARKKLLNEGSSTAEFLKNIKTEGIKVVKKKSSTEAKAC